MNFNEILGSMGIVGLGVMLSLLSLSVYSVAVILGKYRRFRVASSQSQEFLPVFGNCMRQGKLKDAIHTARQHEKSHVAKVVAAGVTEFVGTGGDAGTRVEMVSRALDRSKVQTLTELKSGLGGLATIGSTAPFIGLFGTVVGIINAFRGISAAGSGGVAVVSGGIAEALIATALGIFVAIPAVVAFNHFTGSLERFQVEMNSASSELVDFLHKATRQAVHASR